MNWPAAATNLATQSVTTWLVLTAFAGLLLGTATAGFIRLRRQIAELSRISRTSSGVSELSRQFETYIQSEDVRTDHLVEQLTYALAPEMAGDRESVLLIVREISHSLNTPLQQIEVALRRVKPLVDVNNVESTIRTFSSARQSVDICRAVITAYRDIAGITTTTAATAVKDLASTINAVLEIYIDRKDVNRALMPIEVRSPAKIRGYGNHFLVAIALPLLQNAVEASIEGHTISCQILDRPSVLSIRVTNFVTQQPDLKDLQTYGFSTKGDGHEGLGLASVRTLISRAGGKLSLEYDDHVFTARVELPIRGEADAN